MILCDHHIEKALRDGNLAIDPLPQSGQLQSSSLDLCVGDDFRIWNPALKAPATAHSIDLDNVEISEILDLTQPLALNPQGLIAIDPGAFVLVRTLEHVHLPIRSKLAARVEGRSRQARLGMGVHITAPTIHAGFSGKITLEIINHGVFRLEIRPNVSKLCQLIIEKVSAIPKRGGSASFTGQSTVLGTPRGRQQPS